MSSVGNVQLSVGKLQLPAPPTFLTDEAAVYRLITNQGRSDGGISVYIPPNQSTLNFLCGCFVSLTQDKFNIVPVTSVCLSTIVNIYTHPNQIPGYASVTNETVLTIVTKITNYRKSVKFKFLC